MTSSNFENVVKYLNNNLSSRLTHIPNDIKGEVQEIRLRVNRPLCLCLANEKYYITINGCLSNSIINDNMLYVSNRDIAETFNNMCNYSVYAKQNEIRNGFITLKGGHRVGICGTAVFENEKIINIRDISSMNLRISKEYCDCSKFLFEKINNMDKGVLICGSPCSGKTTILRDVAKKLSMNFNKNVAVIDTRGEIAGTYRGVYQKNIGFCDVLDGYSKKEGFEHSIRCLSPDFIICDEIGSDQDVLSIERAINSGVSIIATLHCNSKKELLLKDNIVKLLRLKAFNCIVFLDTRNNPGKVLQVVSCSDLLP